EGRSPGLRWLIRDITARKAMEGALRAEKTFIEGLIDAAQAVVLLADADGRVLRTNAYLEATTGYDRQTLLGTAWLDRIGDPADRTAALSLFQEAGRAGVKAHAPFPLRCREGGVRVVAWAAKPVRDPRGLPAAVLVVGHDITELQEVQRKAVPLQRPAAL